MHRQIIIIFSCSPRYYLKFLQKDRLPFFLSSPIPKNASFLAALKIIMPTISSLFFINHIFTWLNSYRFYCPRLCLELFGALWIIYSKFWRFRVRSAWSHHTRKWLHVHFSNRWGSSFYTVLDQPCPRFAIDISAHSSWDLLCWNRFLP